MSRPVAVPHSIEAEQALLGALLVSESAQTTFVLEENLKPGDFYGERHRLAYESIVALVDAGEAVDALTVAEHLRSRGKLQDAGGLAEIDALAAAVPSIANLRSYARIVAERALERRRQAAAFELAANPSDPAAFDRLLEIDLQRGAHARFLTADAFVAVDRPAVEPYMRAGASIALARGTGLLVAGPSGKGKSLAALDGVGKLASDHGGTWLGLDVTGGLKVVCLLLEGSDDDNAARLRQLIAPSARERLVILDRWRGAPIGDLRDETARAVRTHQADVVLIDTLAAFFGDRYDTSVGIPEAAHDDLEQMRRRAGRDFAWIGVHHTRKADRTGKHHDELEEIAGTIAKKADAAIVIRADGEDGPRRQVRFAKIRTGPSVPGKVATFPTDIDEPPRLTIVGELGGRPIAQGTEAQRLAEWIAAHGEPQPVAVILAGFGISETTLRSRRRLELEALGITRAKLPGHGNTHAYGTAEQWRRVAGERLNGTDSNPPPVNPPRGGLTSSGGLNPSADAASQPTADTTRRNCRGGLESPMGTGNPPTNRTVPLRGGQPSGGLAPTGEPADPVAALAEERAA